MITSSSVRRTTYSARRTMYTVHCTTSYTIVYVIYYTTSRWTTILITQYTPRYWLGIRSPYHVRERERSWMHPGHIVHRSTVKWCRISRHNDSQSCQSIDRHYRFIYSLRRWCQVHEGRSRLIKANHQIIINKIYYLQTIYIGDAFVVAVNVECNHI